MRSNTFGKQFTASALALAVSLGAHAVTDEDIMNDHNTVDQIVSYGMGVQGQRFSPMDALNTENIQYLQRERGITFLLIEHDMDLVMRLCDPVIVMSEGAKLMEGPPETVRNDPRVLEAYLGGQYAAAEG